MTIEVGILLVTVAGGLYMAWNIGANDVANAMATSVGSGALTLGQAIVLAGIFEFLGAVLVGSHVTETIRKGIIDTALFGPAGPYGREGPLLLALGMLSALVAAGAWLQFATHLGLPVSTTHSIVGAVVGVGLVAFGLGGVEWSSVTAIVLSWLVSPLLGAVLAFLTFVFIRGRILESDDPIAATFEVAPWLVLVVATIIVLSFVYKVLDELLGPTPFLLALAVAMAVGVLSATVTAWWVRRSSSRRDNAYAYVERVFAGLQIFTACYVAFAHGANDVANAVGPLAAVINLARTGFTDIATEVAVPYWVLILGGAGIVLGLASYGYKVIITVGREITEMTPTRGFSAEFGAATTVLIASRLGLPVSTTHTLVGAVIGVGFAHGIAALNLEVIRRIIGSWIATVPAAAGVAAVLFVLLRLIIL